MTEETLFEKARNLPMSERAAFLNRECPDPAMRVLVDAMLAADDDSVSPLDSPLCSPLHANDHTVTQGSQKRTEDYVPNIPLNTVIAGKYTLVETIGEGGMGSVWRAKQTEPVKRFVAVKLIKAGMDSKQVLARFEAERQALALMDHPNIAKVLDGGLHDGRPFFVMELVKGVPITEYCDANKFDPRQRLELFVQTCQAIQHAHQKGIIHRDIKPSNVLVALYDDKPVVKVIDFGVAKATGGTLTEQTIDTGFGGVVGTPQYMSPEQATFNNLDIDTRSDVYALGVLLYELLAGSPPFSSAELKKKGLLEILRVVREEEPPRPSTKLSTADALPSLSANRGTEPKKLTGLLRNELDWIVMKALEKDRTRRYETANGFAADIQRYLSGEAVQAHPPSTAYRIKKFVKRNRGRVIAASLVLVALVAGVVGTSVGLMRAETARKREADERGKAEQLANDNAALAVAENTEKTKALQATERAVRATIEQEKQLQRARAALFTSQMNRVEAIRETDPAKALELLNDLDACPIELRDAAWCFAANSCNRGKLGVMSGVSETMWAALSPNGKTVAVSRYLTPEDRQIGVKIPGTIELHDRETKKVIGTFPKLLGPPEKFIFSEDGRLLAVADNGPFLTGNEPEAEHVGSRPGRVFIWDVDAGKIIATFEGHTDRVNGIAFSPNGTRFATGCMDGTARIWDVKTAKMIHELKGHTKEVAAVAFHPDGTRLATGSHDNTIRFWDIETGEHKTTWTASTNPTPEYAADRARKESQKPDPRKPYLPNGILSLDFSPDGKMLAASNANWQLEIWDVSGGVTRTLIRDPKWSNPFPPARFHKNGRRVIAGSTLWDIETGRKGQTIPTQGRTDFCREQSILTSRIFLSTGGVQIEFHEIEGPTELAKMISATHKFNISCVAFHPNGELVAYACDKRIDLWDLRSGKLRQSLEGHERNVTAIAFSPDGQILASATSVNRYPPRQHLVGLNPQELKLPPAEPLRLWNVATGETLSTIETTQVDTVSLAYSSDGKMLAGMQWHFPPKSSGKPIVSLWEMTGRKLQATLEPPDIGGLLPVLEAQVLFHPRDGSLVTAVGRHAQIWDIPTRTVRKQFVGASDAVTLSNEQFTSLAVSPDGSMLVVCCMAGLGESELFWFDTTTGQLVYRRPVRSRSTIQFSRDGKNLIVLSGREVHFWDALTMQPRLSFQASTLESPYGVMALSPDGQLLATGFSSRTPGPNKGIPALVSEVNLWNLSHSPTVAVFSQMTGFRFSPDGQTLIAHDSRDLRILDLKERRERPRVDLTMMPRIVTAFHPNSRTFAGGAAVVPESQQLWVRDGTAKGIYPGLVIIWDVQTGERVREYLPGNGVVLDLCYSPDGKSLLLLQDTTEKPVNIWDKDCIVRVLDLESGRVTAEFPFEKAIGNKLTLSPDGKTLAVSVYDDSIVLIDLVAGVVLPRLPAVPHKEISRKLPKEGVIVASGTGGNWLDVVKFTEDSRRLVVRRFNSPDTVVVWDWRAGKQVNERPPETELMPKLPIIRDRPNGRYEVLRINSHQIRSGHCELIDLQVKPPVAVQLRDKKSADTPKKTEKQ